MTSILEDVGCKKSPNDHCALTRKRGRDIDRILAWVDDLSATSASEDALADVVTALRGKHGG